MIGVGVDPALITIRPFAAVAAIAEGRSLYGRVYVPSSTPEYVKLTQVTFNPGASINPLRRLISVASDRLRCCGLKRK